MEDELEPIRVYSWGKQWTEVYYGQDDWPSRACRHWLFEPWWWDNDDE